MNGWKLVSTVNMCIIFFIFGITLETSELKQAFKAWKVLLLGLTSILVLTSFAGGWGVCVCGGGCWVTGCMQGPQRCVLRCVGLRWVALGCVALGCVTLGWVGLGVGLPSMRGAHVELAGEGGRDACGLGDKQGPTLGLGLFRVPRIRSGG